MTLLILRWVLIGAVALVIIAIVGWAWYRVLRFIALKLERPVMWYLDKRWRPVYPPVRPGPGARLEMVVTPNKTATVGWQLAIVVVGLVVMVPTVGITIAALIPPIQAGLFPNSELNITGYLLPVIPLFVVVVSVVLLVAYWYYEWNRRYQKLIVFTDRTYYVRAAPAWLGLIPLPFLTSKRYYESSGPTAYLEETRTATDVQDVGGPRTGTLRDLWSERLSETEQVGSIFLPSRVVLAEDLIQRVSYALGTKSVLVKNGRNGRKLLMRLDAATRTSTSEALLLGRGAEWTPEAALERMAEIDEKFADLFPESDEDYELFTVEDPRPRLWDRTTGLEAVVVKEREPGRIKRLFSGNKPATQTAGVQHIDGSREVFDILWEKLYRKRKKVIGAGLDEEVAWALFNRFRLSPQELARLLFTEGRTKDEILKEFPIYEQG